MTLVLALASEHEVHMTCDFKLTDARTRRPLSVNAHKLVPVRSFAVQALIGATGLAVLSGEPIGDWVARRMGALPMEAVLDDIVDVLREAATDLGRVRATDHKHRHLTFVVGAIQGSQSVLAILSNFQDLRGRFIPIGSVPGPDLRLSITRPSSPRLVVAGQIDAVRKDERKLLERSLRAGVPHDVTRERLAALNRKAAQRNDTVSEGCYAASQLATGDGHTQPFVVEQSGDFIPPDVEEMQTRLGYRPGRKMAADGSPMPIRLVGVTSFVHNPSPAFFREQFKIRPRDTELWNSFGAYEAAQGRHESARTAFARAVALDSHNYVALRNLAQSIWRIDGDEPEARRLFQMALEDPNSEQRRETLAILAGILLGFYGPTDEVEALFKQSCEGRLRLRPASNYAHFLLNHRSEQIQEADEILDQLLRQDPNYGMAVAGKALTLLFGKRDLATAMQIVTAHLDRYPESKYGLAAAVTICLHTEDTDSADAFLRRLANLKDVSNDAVIGFSGLIALQRGVDLRDVADIFNRSTERCNLINLAAVQLSRGLWDEASLILDGIDQGRLTDAARVEYASLRYLIAEIVPDDLKRKLGEFFRSGVPAPLDPILFRSIASHSQTNDRIREGLSRVMRSLAVGR